MPRLTPESAERRRTEILEAALRCFARKGFHATAMHELFEEAGISAGSFYSWFDSKRDVVIAAIARNTPEVTHLLENLAELRTPRIIGELATAFARRFEDDSWQLESQVNVQIWGEALLDDDVKASFLPAFVSYRAILSEAFARDQAEGTLDPALDPDHLATLVWGLLLGFEAQKAWQPDLDAAGWARTVNAVFSPAGDGPAIYKEKT